MHFHLLLKDILCTLHPESLTLFRFSSSAGGYPTLHPESSTLFRFSSSAGGYPLYPTPFSALSSHVERYPLTSTFAILFWQISFTVTFCPFHALVALAMSSPTFLGDCKAKPVSTQECHDSHMLGERDIFVGLYRETSFI